MNGQTPRNLSAASPDEPSVAGDDELIGRVIDDRYELIEHLGEGGMGSVYAAEHLKLHKQVALKIIHPEFAGDGEIAARFAREAMASAQLEHPHVASALDYGTLPEGGAYLVMQLVRGKSVQDLVEEHGALPCQQACEVAAQVADALAAAHGAGIVHRDLKPDNILLREHPDGSFQVKVLDFGIARVAMKEGGQAPEGAAPGKALTRVGTVMGTPGYMSPEQSMGEVVDHRTDIYALGVVLWEMICGREMFGTRDLTAIVTKQLTEPAPPLAGNAPSQVPAQLEQLVASMLASRAPDRPGSASQIRDGLRRLVFGQTAPVSGTVQLPGMQRDRSEATAQTMLAKATGPVGTAQQARATGVAAPSRSIAERLRAIPMKWAAAGCGALVAATLTVAVTIAALSGDPEKPDETAPAQGPAPGMLAKLKQLTENLPAPGPVVPPEVQEKIDTMFDGANRRERRDAAQQLLDHEPQTDVPAYALAAAELETARGCRAKKEVIERIREEELEGAMPTLERMADTPRRGCGFLGVNDCYSCLRRELSETIGALGGDEPDEGAGGEETEGGRGRR